MAKKNKAKPSKTIQSYRRYRNAHNALKATELSAPVVPFGVVLAVNWNEWFPQNKDHTPIAIGLVMSILSLILSVVAIANKDKEFMKRMGPFIPIAVAFLGWGTVCILLSEILIQLGFALLSTGVGIIVSATADIVDKNAVNERYEYLKELCDKNGLSEEGEWKEEAKEQALKDAEEKRSVRYVPHD